MCPSCINLSKSDQIPSTIDEVIQSYCREASFWTRCSFKEFHINITTVKLKPNCAKLEIHGRERRELTLSDGAVLGRHPPVDDHGRVVVDMEEGHLVVLLAQNEEYGIGELDDLREEEEPTDADQLNDKH